MGGDFIHSLSWWECIFTNDLSLDKYPRIIVPAVTDKYGRQVCEKNVKMVHECFTGAIRNFKHVQLKVPHLCPRTYHLT